MTVPKRVKDIIFRSPYLYDAIEQNLINLSSLARKIQPEIEEKLKKKVSESSIIMALKRLSEKISEKKIIDYSKFLGDISLKSGLRMITYKNSYPLFKNLNSINRLVAEVINEVDASNHYINFVRGSWQTTMIFSNKLATLVEELFKDNKIEQTNENLASITIKLISNYYYEPGIIAYILNIIAWNNINVLEVLSTLDELTVIIENKDVSEAFRVISKISNGD